MNRFIIVLVGLLLAVGLGTAGEYHFGAQLDCSDCHTMHQSQQHDYAGVAGAVDYLSPTADRPLLKESERLLCLTCHDGDTAPDVYGADTSSGGPWPAGGSTPTARSAGALNDSVAQVDGTYDNYEGHSLGSTATAPGGTFANAAGLVCSDCHDPHGNPQGAVDAGGAAIASTYRNLHPAGGTVSISYVKSSTNNTGVDVFVNSATNNTYETDSINLNEPWEGTDQSGFGEWCGNCHSNFHGAPTDAEIGGSGSPVVDFLRHPSAGVDIGGVGDATHSDLATWEAIAYRVRVMSPTGNWGTQGTAFGTGNSPTDLTPTCLTCHKAHGSSRPFGLIYALGTSPLGEDGDGTGMEDLCKQCHIQGS